MEAEGVEEELKKYVGRVMDAFSSLLASNQEQPFLQAPNHSSYLAPISQNMLSIFKRLDMGMHTLLRLVVELSQDENPSLTKQRIDEIGQLVAVAAVVKQHSARFTQEMAEGIPLKEIFGVQEETLHLLYSGAKYLFDQQHYFEASSAFAVLTLLDPSAYLFWMGLGTSEYLQGRFEAALLAYAMAAQADSGDALSHIYSAHCYLALKQKDRATHSLEIALLAAESTDNEQVLKHRIIQQLIQLRGEKS